MVYSTCAIYIWHYNDFKKSHCPENNKKITRSEIKVGDYTGTSRTGNVKVLYLLLLATGLFFIKDIQWIAAIGLFQLILWFHAKLGISPIIRAFSRLKWFFLQVIISYLLIPPTESIADFELNLGFYTLNFYLAGLEQAALMLSRVALLIITSLWVRLSMPAGQFISALKNLGVPETIAIVIDAGLSLTADKSSKKGSGSGGGQGNGGGKNKQRKKITVLFADLRQGNFGFLDDLLSKALKKSQDFLQQRYPNIAMKFAMMPPSSWPLWSL